MQGYIRETRLVDKSLFDETSEFLEAGSVDEFIRLSELEVWDLVDMIQLLDAKLWAQENKNKD